MSGERVAGLADFSECFGGECPHRMVPRCPSCGVEMYLPAVFAFSHGVGHCRCGFLVVPEVVTAIGPS